MGIAACKQTNDGNKASMKKIISQQVVDETAKELGAKFPGSDKELIRKGVSLTSEFWTAEDGSANDFREFCLNNYKPEERKQLLQRFSENLETVYGRYAQISKQMQFSMHVSETELLPVDEIFAAWRPLCTS